MIERDIEEIRLRAYELYEWYRDEGYPNNPMRDWLEAEVEILRERANKTQRLNIGGDLNGTR